MFFLWKSIQSAIQNVTRHGLLSFTSVFIFTLCLLSLTLVGVTNVVMNDTLELVEKKLTIAVELNEGVSSEQVSDMMKKLKATSLFREIQYISKDEALKNFEKRFQEKPMIVEFLKGMKDNPLYASLILSTDTLDAYTTIKSTLESPEYSGMIREIKDQKNQSNRFSTYQAFQKTLIKVGIVVGIIFLFIAIMIIFNTIKIGIHYRQKEIKIMRLVGASYSYIILPFILEGIIYSIFALFFSTLILISVAVTLQESEVMLLAFIAQSMKDFYEMYQHHLSVALITLALSIGMMSSYAAVMSYLREHRIE